MCSPLFPHLLYITAPKKSKGQELLSLIFWCRTCSHNGVSLKPPVIGSTALLTSHCKCIPTGTGRNTWGVVWSAFEKLSGNNIPLPPQKTAECSALLRTSPECLAGMFCSWVHSGDNHVGRHWGLGHASSCTIHPAGWSLEGALSRALRRTRITKSPTCFLGSEPSQLQHISYPKIIKTN